MFQKKSNKFFGTFPLEIVIRGGRPGPYFEKGLNIDLRGPFWSEKNTIQQGSWYSTLYLAQTQLLCILAMNGPHSPHIIEFRG